MSASPFRQVLKDPLERTFSRQKSCRVKDGGKDNLKKNMGTWNLSSHIRDIAIYHQKAITNTWSIRRKELKLLIEWKNNGFEISFEFCFSPSKIQTTKWIPFVDLMLENKFRKVKKSYRFTTE